MLKIMNNNNNSNNDNNTSLSPHHSLDHVGNQEGRQRNVGEDADPTRNSALRPLHRTGGPATPPRHPTPAERDIPPGFGGTAKTFGGTSRGRDGAFSPRAGPWGQDGIGVNEK